MFRLLCFGLFVLIVLSFGVSAATINAVSGSSSDIQSAVDKAKSGDVVLIPEGEWELSTKITINKAKIGVKILPTLFKILVGFTANKNAHTK